MNQPPPLPHAIPSGPSPQPTGAEGGLTEEILADIQRGGRFRSALYCVSILILSFRRSFEVRYVPAGQSNAASAMGASLITGLFGWWGIPWGPIYSIGSLIANFNGGKDVTKDILAAQFGEAEARNFLARSQKSRATAGLWALRALILGGPVFSILLLVGGAAMGSKVQADRLASDPAYRDYQALIDSIAPTGAGNTPEARKIAQGIAATVDLVVDQSLQGEDGSASKSDCSAACYQSSKGSMLLVRVSSMTKFTESAKQEIVDSVWSLASSAVASPDKPEHQLIVGVGGRYFWDGARSGVLPAASDESSDPKVRVTSAVEVHLEEAFPPIWVPAE